jgi:hypothetical protein
MASGRHWSPCASSPQAQWSPPPPRTPGDEQLPFFSSRALSAASARPARSGQFGRAEPCQARRAALFPSCIGCGTAAVRNGIPVVAFNDHEADQISCPRAERRGHRI